MKFSVVFLVFFIVYLSLQEIDARRAPPAKRPQPQGKTEVSPEERQEKRMVALERSNRRLRKLYRKLSKSVHQIKVHEQMNGFSNHSVDIPKVDEVVEDDHQEEQEKDTETDDHQPELADGQQSNDDNKLQMIQKHLDKFQELDDIKAELKRLNEGFAKIIRMNGFPSKEFDYCPSLLANDEQIPCSKIGSTCYCFPENGVTWKQATDFCIKNGMFLVALETEEENQLVYQHIKHSETLPHSYYWSSGQQFHGQWLWKSNGQSLNYVNWFENQPDGNSTENCITMNILDGYDGKWDDWDCNTSHLFICEW